MEKLEKKKPSTKHLRAMIFEAHHPSRLLFSLDDQCKKHIKKRLISTE